MDRNPRRIARAAAVGLIALGLPASSLLGAPCANENRPAATLLVPYFEVDLASPGGKTTLFSVANRALEPNLAHVVLWTTWGQPTLAFDVLLMPGQSQSLSVGEILHRGRLPSLSALPEVLPLFPGCEGVEAEPTLDATELEKLRARHSGQPDPDDGLCYGSSRADGVAVGYITVDVVNDCSEAIRYPGDDGYFETGGTGLAGSQNVLWGDYFLVDPASGLSAGLATVPIPAEEAIAPEADGTYRTFYGHRVGWDGSDLRRRLPSTYAASYHSRDGGGMSTDLVIWTDISSEPKACSRPFDPPAPTDTSRPSIGAWVYEQSGRNLPKVELFQGEGVLRVRVGSETLPVTSQNGTVEVQAYDLGCGVCSPTPLPRPLQGWLGSLVSARGFAGAGHPATAIDSSCAK